MVASASLILWTSSQRPCHAKIFFNAKDFVQMVRRSTLSAKWMCLKNWEKRVLCVQKGSPYWGPLSWKWRICASVSFWLSTTWQQCNSPIVLRELSKDTFIVRQYWTAIGGNRAIPAAEPWRSFPSPERSSRHLLPGHVSCLGKR